MPDLMGDKYLPKRPSGANPAVLHVHTDDCWQDNFECAKWKVAQQAVEISNLKMIISTCRVRLRTEVGGILDKIDQKFTQALRGL